MSKTARDVAWETVSKWSMVADPPRVPERADVAWADLPARERAQAFDLVNGIIRWRGLLDALLGVFINPGSHLDPTVRAVLWIGAYQMLMQASAKPYAAVDEAVELCKRRASARASGLVNAVLRNILRSEPRRKARGPASSFRFPCDAGHDIVFKRAMLPSPERSVAAYLAAATSHPPEFVAMLLATRTVAQATEILIADNHRPAIILRADDAVFAPDAAAGLMPHGVAGYFAASEGWNAEVEGLVKRGVLSPQDPTAGVAAGVLLAGLPNGARVCDLCAGLGTKTMQMARARPDVKVVATDVDAAKLEKLRQRLKEMGLANVEVAGVGELSGPFDGVLVDAPCSNSGVFARRVQARWRWPKLDMAAMTRLQLNLLAQGAGLVGAGGILVYATCSIDPQENGEVVARWRSGRRADVLSEQVTVPSQTGDGGYYARLGMPEKSLA